MEEGLLPRAVASVAKADFEPFANGKRIGSYLFGRTIGEGSFAKVKEGFHVSTGEKVWNSHIEGRRIPVLFMPDDAASSHTIWSVFDWVVYKRE